jgi:hypothetical protein
LRSARESMPLLNVIETLKILPEALYATFNNWSLVISH